MAPSRQGVPVSVVVVALAAICAFALAWSRPAHADEIPRVLILEPGAPTLRERELSTRLMGELRAAGFEVLSQPLYEGGDVRVAVAVQGSELDPVAAFAIGSSGAAPESDEPEARGLQLWLSDRIEGAIIFQAGEDGQGGSKAVSLLAVQGVELLQARVAGLRLKTEPVPRELDRAPEPSSASKNFEVGASVAVAALWDADSGGTSATPLLRVSATWQLGRGEPFFAALGARVSGAGWGSATVIRTPARYVDVRQSFGLLEALMVLSPPGGWLEPYAVLGGGAYRVGVEGVGQEQAIGRTGDTCSPVASLGVGLSCRILKQWVFETEGQSILALHPTAVQIDGAGAATFGRPLFVLSIGLGVRL